MALAAPWHPHNATSAVFEGVCSGSVCVLNFLRGMTRVQLYVCMSGDVKKPTVSCERLACVFFSFLFFCSGGSLEHVIETLC